MSYSPSRKMAYIVAIVIVVVVVLGGVYFLQYGKHMGITIPGVNSVLPAALLYQSHTVTLADGNSFDLTLPKGFNAAVAASDLGRARFMAESPDGRLFVTDMKDLSDNFEGKIYILDNFNKETKKFEGRVTYLSGLHNPNSITFYQDASGAYWLYVALTDKLVRYRYAFGETAPTALPQTLATFPAYGLSYKYGGWHLTRTVKIHNDKVFVSVGSSCDSCEEKTDEKVRASIVEMNPDGSNQQIIATGLRNAVGLYFKGDVLYASGMGADKLGDDKPEEILHAIKPGANYGWPYCYQYQGKIYADNSKVWDRPIDCSTVPLAYATFPAHSAPLGLAYFDSNAAPELANSFLLALHGSSTVSLAHGYKIVRINEKGEVVDFISGFLDGITRYSRPVDILPDSGSSFFFTDDLGGNIYYIYK